MLVFCSKSLGGLQRDTTVATEGPSEELFDPAWATEDDTEAMTLRRPSPKKRHEKRRRAEERLEMLSCARSWDHDPDFSRRRSNSADTGVSLV